MKVDGSNILVTGGAGFIGSELVRELLLEHNPKRVVVLDALTYAGNLKNLVSVELRANYAFQKADIRIENEVNKVFAEHGPFDLVFHLAAESHVDRSILGPLAFVETNVIGTAHLLQAFRKQNEAGDSGRFVHVSTDEVYGSLGADGKFSRKSPYDPKSPYSASKAASDHLAKSFEHTYGIDIIVTNCSNNYGQFQFPEKLIPLVINNCVQKKPIPIYGKGDNVRDWIYVGDHAKALISAAENGASGKTYLFGGENELQNLDLVHQVCKIVDTALNQDLGKSSRLINFVKDRAGHDQRYAIDNTDATKELGWTPQTTFEEGIGKTVHWYLNNRTWLDDITSGSYMEYYEQQYDQR